MEARTVYEIIGYVGSALVLISFLMSSVLKLRIINSAGSLVSVVYGLFVHTYPTVVMNACLLLINIYYILKYLNVKNEKIYRSRIVTTGSGTLGFFLARHEEDIKSFFPNFRFDKETMNYARFIFLEDTIVGVMIGTKTGDTLNLCLDYATPKFRDFSVGRYAYKTIRGEGVSRVVFSGDIPKSYIYLKKLGFVKEGKTMVLNY